MHLSMQSPLFSKGWGFCIIIVLHSEIQSKIVNPPPNPHLLTWGFEQKNLPQGWDFSSVHVFKFQEGGGLH